MHNKCTLYKGTIYVEVLNYTYHKPQIIRYIFRITVFPQVLNDIQEIVKDDGSHCH